MSDDNKNKKPIFSAYTSKKIGEGKYINRTIGAGWEHEDGRGVDIVLDAVPVDGRLSIRLKKEGETESESNT